MRTGRDSAVRLRAGGRARAHLARGLSPGGDQGTYVSIQIGGHFSQRLRERGAKHGPVKVLGLESGVNITVGLPVVRTSVDHGTAFDIAGKGVADQRSMMEAIRQAAELAP